RDRRPGERRADRRPGRRHAAAGDRPPGGGAHRQARQRGRRRALRHRPRRARDPGADRPRRRPGGPRRRPAAQEGRVIEQVLFDVSEALRVPVLVAALAALAIVLVEAGALMVELRRRRRRSLAGLERAVEECRGRLAAGMPVEAVMALLRHAWNRRMEEALAGIVEQHGRPHAEARIAKRLAELDYLSLRRLERTRVLVRMGPALGLMGTLIPLSPALA